MRPDQFKTLRDLSERLADVVIGEADPDGWPGAGKDQAEMTQQERGDRYWAKKNAIQTCSLLTRVCELGGEVSGGATTPDLDAEIKDAERKAKKLLEKAMAKSGK